MTADNGIAGVWRSFLDEYRERLAVYSKELALSWRDLRSLLDTLEEELVNGTRRDLEPDSLASLRGCFTNEGESLLFGPVRKRVQYATQQRSLHALTDLRTSLDDIVRQLPVKVFLSGREMAEQLTGAPGGGLRRRWLFFSRKPRPLAVRRIVAERLRRDERLRANLDGEFQLLLAQASLHLIGPWHVFRQRSLDLFEDGQEALGRADQSRRRWLKKKRKLLRTGERLLQRYEKWLAAAPGRLVEAILSRPGSKPAVEKIAPLLAEHYSYWSRQQRAVHAVLDLEVSLARLAVTVTEGAERALDALDEEHEALLGELDTTLEWLRRRRDRGTGEAWPAEQTKLLSAEARATQLVNEFAEVARRALPEAVETINPKKPFPGWRKPWRRLEPEAIFLRVLEATKEQAALEGLREAEAVHRSIIRELERAKEVVAFGEEAERSGETEGAQLAAEGIDNAVSLLEYHRSHAAPVRPAAERGLTRGIAGGFLESYISLDQGRLGLLAHLAQEASERGVQRVGILALNNVQSGTTAALQQGRAAWNRVLISLGLQAPPSPPSSAVFRAQRLEETLEHRLVRPGLPLLYRRLFRLEPVEDPRFLVGRYDELGALVEARAQWLSGKAVSVVVVGARGSGKSSLLNCASQIAFHNLAITRTQFERRLTDPAEMERFLRDALEISPGKTIEQGLKGSERVIILEEVERSFLRTMNGFEALRFLLHLVASTWHDALWILSLNESAHGILNRVAEFDRYFTHGLNAMGVRIGDIREAVMMRHNLSGYRLAFPPARESDPKTGRLRRTLGIEPEPSDLFFEALYKNSEGIFRAAFETWLHHIERVEGGVVHLRQPVEPNLGPLREALSYSDCFTLQALLQHGGLTAEDLARIFAESPHAGQTRLERLLAMELLETDPAGPGLRVRPEAGRVVREALHRRNL